MHIVYIMDCGNSWESPEFQGLRGWEGQWDCSVLWGTVGIPESPQSPRDSGDGKDCVAVGDGKDSVAVGNCGNTRD